MSDDGLPEGWAAGTLPEVASIIMGQSPPGKTYNETGDGLAFFQGKADFGSIHPSVRKWCSAPGKIAEAGDVLISIRAPVGPTNIADRRCAIGRGLAALRPAYGIPSLFLLYAIRLQEDALAEQGTGSTFTAINRDHLDALGLCVPPLAEQQRIVAKVEALLARVNAARQRLARAPAILKRFRQSVLAAACSGRLTADWRDDQGDLEAATTLLERMHVERRQANGKAAAGRRAVRSDGELPSSWAWARVSDLLHYTRAAGYGVLQPGSDLPGGVPMVRVCDIGNGTVLVEQLKRIDAKIDAQYRRTRLQGGEVLVTLVGTIGRTAVAPPTAAGANIARAVAMLPLCPLVVPRYVHYALAEPSKNAELFDLAREVARKTLNLGLLKDAVLPLPPFAEQHEIVRRVKALFRLADAIEKRVAAATARAEKLTQAILARAFRGELVPTEAELARRESRGYELASALLERIRTERAQSDNARQRIPGKGNARQVRRRKGQPQ